LIVLRSLLGRCTTDRSKQEKAKDKKGLHVDILEHSDSWPVILRSSNSHAIAQEAQQKLQFPACHIPAWQYWPLVISRGDIDSFPRKIPE